MADKDATKETKSLREQKLEEFNDPTSKLRQQDGVENTMDFQLLSNTNAHTIAAMTGKTIEQLQARALELGTTLKGSAAFDGGPGSGR